MNRIFVSLPALLALAAFGSPAHAQGMPVDTINNAFAAQVEWNQFSNDLANWYGWQAYGMMQDYRAQTGFTGEFPNFVTPQQQFDSNRALNDAYARARQSGYANSDVRAGGANTYGQLGILGQQPMVGPGGTYYPYVSNDYDRVFDTPNGMVYTNDPTYQPWNGMQLMPAR